MSQGRKTMLLRIVAALMVAVLSLFLSARIAASPELYARTNEYLDGKKVAVLELAGAAAALSFAVSAIPDDAGTPIAEELADLGGYFLLIVSAIVFEKYLFGIAGAVTFRYLIPIACAMFILYALLGSNSFRKGAKKLLAFALAVFLIVPASVGISRIIEERYSCSAAQTVASLAEDTSEITEENAQTQQPPDGQTDKKTWWSGIVDTLSDTAEKLKNSVSETTASMKEKLTALIGKYIDALAVMIVTSCVIPIAVLLALVWLLKLIFSLDWDVIGGAQGLFARRRERRDGGKGADAGNP